MTRARTVSYVLWAVCGTGCGGDDGGGGRLPDAPPSRGPALAFGAMPSLTTTCGLSPAASELTVTNTGDATLTITNVAVSGGFTVTSQPPTSLTPGAQATLAIRPPTAVIGTDRGGQVRAGTLTLTTNEPAMPTRSIELSATVIGANLVFTDAQARPMTLVATGTSGACPAPVPVFLRNTGNRPVTVGEASASGFAISGFSTGTIAPFGTEMQMYALRTDGPCSGTEDVAYPVTGTVCHDGTAVLETSFSMDRNPPCFCS